MTEQRTDGPLTDAEIESLEELCAKATPGPWEVIDKHGGCKSIGSEVQRHYDGDGELCTFESVVFTHGIVQEEADAANALLIVALRNYADRLLAELRLHRSASTETR
jgi:hypothetical protein